VKELKRALFKQVLDDNLGNEYNLSLFYASAWDCDGLVKYLLELGANNYNAALISASSAGFPIVRPVRAKVSPGPDDNFRGKQTKDCLGLGQQSHGRKDYRALQSSSTHYARRYYNTNMITYKQTRPSAHYQASSIHNCSSSASVCMWTLASSGTQPQHSDTSRIWSLYRP